MTIPRVSVKKSRTGASAAQQSSDGVLAVIASASAGPLNTPMLFADDGQLEAEFPLGPLPEYCVYDLDVSGNPVLAIRGNTSIAATYSAITKTIAGTANPAAGGTSPLEHYAVQVNILTGGTVGIAGIIWNYSLDGGDTVSGPQALGTLTTFTIPSSGVSFTVAGASTFVTGDSFSCFTERPLLNNSDVTTALTALQQTRLPWEGVLIDCAYITGTAGLVDTWLAGREAKGQFGFALLNYRYLTEPTPTGETPNAYANAFIAATQNDASDRLCVGADGGHAVSLITGLNLKRPTSLALGAMAMSLTPNIGVDPAFVGNGAVPDYQIDNGANPNDWDEDIYELLDAQRAVTLRSFAPGGPQGVYITNANVLCATGSVIVWLQLLRVMNKGCRIAWANLNTQLSRGVRTVLNEQTGALNIDPRDAQAIEALVNSPLVAALSGQVTAVRFVLSQSDDLTNAGAPVNGFVEIDPLAYLKAINVTTALVKKITVPLGGA